MINNTVSECYVSDSVNYADSITKCSYKENINSQ